MGHIVIIGGGIIGLSTAYSLLTSPHLPSNTAVTLVENTSIACAASSKAAGFIGGSPAWHAPGNVDLARASFDRYQALAQKFNGTDTYGWRLVDVTGVRVGTQEDEEMSAYRQLPTGSAPVKNGKEHWAHGTHVPFEGHQTAQLYPGEFCHLLHAECAKLGLTTLIAHPLSRKGKVITTSEGDVSYDKLVIAAGPWSADVCTILSLPPVPVSNLPGTHVVIRPGTLPGGYSSVPAEMLFCGIGAGEGSPTALPRADPVELQGWEREQGWTPFVEFFPRPDGTIYAAGENNIPQSIGNRTVDARKNRFPLTARYVSGQTDDALVQRLMRAAKAVSPVMDTEHGAELVLGDFCYRPVTADKMPIIGEWSKDVFVCAGHGPWGITLAPGSGQVTAELVLASLTGTKVPLSVDISALSPHRFAKAKL